MAYLTVFSEKSPLCHVACKFEHEGGKGTEWYGFEPVKRNVIARGRVHQDDRTANIRRSLRFDATESHIAEAIKVKNLKYENAYYVLGVKDCYSFVADVAGACGLVLIPRPNWFPDTILMWLRVLNSKRLTHVDNMPFNLQIAPDARNIYHA